MGQRTATTLRYFVHDALGSVVHSIDAAGTTVDSYGYRTWGDHLWATPPTSYKQPWQFAGEYNDGTLTAP